VNPTSQARFFVSVVFQKFALGCVVGSSVRLAGGLRSPPNGRDLTARFYQEGTLTMESRMRQEAHVWFGATVW